MRIQSLLFLAVASALTACGRTPIDDLPGAGGATSGCSSAADCPPGEHCSTPTHTCVPTPGGCQSDADCAAPTPYCRLDTHTCVECTESSQCPSGEECSSFQCVGFCGSGQACANGLTCCSQLCVDTATNVSDCGACGLACPAGDTCSGGVCAGPCGPAGCPDGETCCGALCASTTTDPDNCGACGNVCPTMVPNGTAGCVSASCQITSCLPGFANCDGVLTDGCDIDTQHDPKNCGACGHVCPGDDECCAGECSPAATDSHNCGHCGVVCPDGESCSGGKCSKTCNGGPACAGDLQCCPTGCSDTTSDPKNCGVCGQACAPADACVMGKCVAPATCNGGPLCASSQTCCEAGCTDAGTDPSNCGTCGNVCGPTSACVGGTCAANEGALSPTSSPYYLPPGPHSYTSINIPAGVVVYVSGSGPASGTLDLTSSGPIVIHGTIDLSGGPGTRDQTTSATAERGTAGSGGYTGEPTVSAPPSSACQWVAGNSGANGFGISGLPGTCAVLSTTICATIASPSALVFTAPVAQYGGGAGVFTGFRAYGSGGGGPAGGAPGALCDAFPGEQDCADVSGGGGAIAGQGGGAGIGVYDGTAGVSGSTQCPGLVASVPPACVGGGGGGSIGLAAANDLAIVTTFQTGSGGGGGSGDYLNRPVFGGTSGGGGGGGALRLTSPVSITIGSTAKLLADGGVGGDSDRGNGANAGCDPQPGAAGGGGSGGVIYLATPSLSVAGGALVSAVGGAGGAQSEFATGGGGGNGGLGRIRLSITPTSCTVGGTFNPPLASGCTPAAAKAGNVYVGTYPN